MNTGRLFIIGVTILILFLAYSSQYFIFWNYLGGLNVQTLQILGPFNLCVLLLLYNYYLTCITDPGRVPKDWVCNSLSRKLIVVEKLKINRFLLQRPNMIEDVEVKKSDERTPRYCKTCKTYKPPRAHHCKTCQRSLFERLLYI
jgi:palmitoyltransferase ZDHHC6